MDHAKDSRQGVSGVCDGDIGLVVKVSYKKDKYKIAFKEKDRAITVHIPGLSKKPRGERWEIGTQLRVVTKRDDRGYYFDFVRVADQ